MYIWKNVGKILNFFLGSFVRLEGFGFHYRTGCNGLIAYILHVSWLCFVYLLDWICLPILNSPPLFPHCVVLCLIFQDSSKGLCLALHFLELFGGGVQWPSTCLFAVLSLRGSKKSFCTVPAIPRWSRENPIGVLVGSVLHRLVSKSRYYQYLSSGMKRYCRKEKEIQ